MKVDLTLEEVCRLHHAAAILSALDGIPSDEQKAFISAARKLRGAAERSGARIENNGSAWKLPPRR